MSCAENRYCCTIIDEITDLLNHCTIHVHAILMIISTSCTMLCYLDESATKYLLTFINDVVLLFSNVENV